MKKVYIGTSGYQYKGWKGVFYPEDLPQKDWMDYYTKTFNTVEINTSFYHAVRPSTYEKWYEKTPEDFVFVIKGHRAITQYKKLLDIDESVKFFFDATLLLKEKLGVVLWQFPPSFALKNHEKEYMDRLEHFLKLLPENIPQAFEFRHDSWFVPDVEKMILSYNATLVISDTPRFPSPRESLGSFAYIRFHGPGALYASSYSDEELQRWAKKIAAYRKTMPVFCFFNNDNFGYAIENAQQLKTYIEKG